MARKKDEIQWNFDRLVEEGAPKTTKGDKWMSLMLEVALDRRDALRELVDTIGDWIPPAAN